MKQKRATLKQKKATNGGPKPKSKYASKIETRSTIAFLLGEDDKPTPVLLSEERIAIDGNDGSVPAEASFPGDGI